MAKHDLHRMIDELDDREAAELSQALRLLMTHGGVVLAGQVEELRRRVSDLGVRVGFLEGSFKGFESRFEDLARRLRGQ